MAAVNLIMMQTLVPFVVIAYITILIYKQLFWNYTINSFQSIFPTTWVNFIFWEKSIEFAEWNQSFQFFEWNQSIRLFKLNSFVLLLLLPIILMLIFFCWSFSFHYVGQRQKFSNQDLFTPRFVSNRPKIEWKKKKTIAIDYLLRKLNQFCTEWNEPTFLHRMKRISTSVLLKTEAWHESSFILFYLLLIFASLRFDLERPSGFLISTIVQIATVHITSEIFLIILMVIAQLRLFEADFILDLKQNLKELNEKMTLGNGNEKLTADDRDEIKKKLVDLMQFYAEAKELSICF